MWMASALHDLTYFLTVTACSCSQHDFGSKEKVLCSSILVNASCKAVVSFDDFQGNELQAIAGGCLH